MEDNKNKSDDLDELARDLTLSSSGSETQSNTESSDTYTDTEGSYSTKATTEPSTKVESTIDDQTDNLTVSNETEVSLDELSNSESETSEEKLEDTDPTNT